AASATVSACSASGTGCRPWMGTTAVPSATSGTSRAATASAVSASTDAVWGSHTDRKPSAAAARTRSTTSSTDDASAPAHNEIATIGSDRRDEASRDRGVPEVAWDRWVHDAVDQLHLLEAIEQHLDRD